MQTLCLLFPAFLLLHAFITFPVYLINRILFNDQIIIIISPCVIYALSAAGIDSSLITSLTILKAGGGSGILVVFHAMPQMILSFQYMINLHKMSVK